MADLLVLPRPAKSVQNGADFSRKTRTYWVFQYVTKGKSGLSATKRTVGKYAKAVCPKHHIVKRERVKVGENHTFASEREIRVRAWRGKSGLHGRQRQIPKRTGRASKKSLPRISKKKYERVSGCKSSPGRSEESWFHSKSGQT